MKKAFDRMMAGRMMGKRIFIVLSFRLAIALCLLVIALSLGAAERAGSAEGVDAESQQSVEPADKAVRAPAAQISPPELDRAIEQVIHQRKYTWRLPRESVNPMQTDEPGLLGKFFAEAGRLIRTALKNVFEWLGKAIGRVLGWIFRGWTPPSFESPGTLNWYLISQILLYLLLAVVLSAVAILLYRFWQNRRRPREVLQAEAIQPVPDLTDENVSAEQLPEDGWTKLARELLARGEFRLALRAFYLASLAHLAERNLLSLARFKSNRDYLLELSRRAHSFPNLLQVFGENVGAFDRVWYGTHEASGELVTQFEENVERIKGGE